MTVFKGDMSIKSYMSLICKDQSLKSLKYFKHKHFKAKCIHFKRISMELKDLLTGQEVLLFHTRAYSHDSVDRSENGGPQRPKHSV